MNDFDDLPDEEFDFDSPDFPAASGLDDSPDEFDQLRRTSVRRETMDSALTEDDIRSGTRSSSGFSMSNFSPGQRMVLAILVFLNILVISVGLLAVLGIIG